MIGEIFGALPDWAGTAPQWFLLAVVAAGVFKVWPVIRQQNIDFTHAARAAYEVRIDKLENNLRECEKRCDERETFFKSEIDQLKTKLNNEAWQRVQSEISLVNTLIQVVPSPELKIILEALQRRNVGMHADITALGKEPLADLGKTGK